jgi:hypothetical protein
MRRAFARLSLPLFLEQTHPISVCKKTREWRKMHLEVNTINPPVQTKDHRYVLLERRFKIYI